MKFRIIGLLAGVSLISPALADNIPEKDANARVRSMATKTTSGVEFRKQICVTLADTSIDCSTAILTALAAANASLDDIETASEDTTIPAVKIDQTTPGTTNLVNSYGFAGTATTTITRPADTTAYTAADSFGDSTGGHTLSSVCRASGGSGVMTDFILVYSTTQVVVGEVWFYDASITETDDNAAWAVSDADQLKLVGKVAFTTVADTANNSVYHEKNLNMGYTCAGTANLRYQVKVTTGYTPASADTLTIRAKFIQSN